MADGQRDLIDPNKLFSNQLRFMENSVLAFLQALFGTFTPGALRYSSTEADTEISIEGRSTDNLKNVDVRPKIVVARGPVSWRGTGLGGGSFIGSKNLSRERQAFADINEGSVGISCFSRNDLEADQIAQICYDAIKMFRPVLQRYGFLSIHAAQVGARAMVKSDVVAGLFVTPVLVQMQLTKNWTTSKIDPVELRKVLLNYTIGPNV